MIRIGGQTLDLSDPMAIAALAAAGFVMLLLLMLLATLRRAGRSAAAAEAMAAQLGAITRRTQTLADGQQQLYGGLNAVTDAQAQSQAQMLALMEQRLAEVTRTMGENLQGASTRTARSLGELHERLAAIDKAQDNITRLSGDVLSLQDILSNKQTRGAFGEIQLNEIVSRALPPDAYSLQATLPNGKRADCLVHLPQPPGPIAIDAKFPLEAYEALRNADSDRDTRDAARMFRLSVRAHIKAISEKYILPGETAEGALMFLPSEAVYAELHANYPDLVREGFVARVWIVSPTTCMATLNTLRAVLKDARMREQAGAIRKTLRLLHRDVELVVDRVGKLDAHFRQARDDLDGIGTAAERAGKRAARLESFDFDDRDQSAALPLVQRPQDA